MDDERIALHALARALIAEPSVELAADAAELALDAALAEGLTKEIPIVGSVVKVVAAARTARDVFLARKLGRFIEQIQDIDAGARREFLHAHFSTAKERTRMHEIVLHTIDSFRSSDRVEHVSSLFRALVHGRIDKAQFVRLCPLAQFLETGHMATLAKLAEAQPRLCTDAELLFLLMHALAVQDWTPHGDGYGGRYVRTSLGSALHRALTT